MSRESLRTFLRACALAEPPRLLIRTAGADHRRRVQLPGPFAVLGSDPRVNVCWHVPDLALRHCYLQAVGPRVLCVDLRERAAREGSETGVPLGWIESGRGVRVGEHEITLAAERKGEEGTPPRPPGDRSPKITLEFRENHCFGRWVMTHRFALVGSAPGCTIRLNSPSVSRFHAAFLRTRQGLWVVDLLGQVDSPEFRGIAVNGVRVRFARLDLGDVLEVGRFRVSLHDSGASPVMDPPAGQPGGFAPALKEAIAALRHEFDAKLAAEARNHRIEVESLRRELRDLRERARAVEAHECRNREHDALAAPDCQRSSSGTSARALGTALKLENPTPPPQGAIAHEASTSSSPIRLGLVSIATSGFSSVPGGTQGGWSKPENDVASTPHAS